MDKQPRQWQKLWRWFLKPEGIGYLLVSFWAIGGGLATAYLPVARLMEKQTQSTFFSWRGAIEPPAEIVILAIDEQSLSQGEFYDPEQRAFLEPLQSWPWQRAAYAQVIEQLMAAGAKVVAIDILLDTPSIYGFEDDDRLQATLDNYGDRVVLAASLDFTDTQEALIMQLLTPEETYFLDYSSIGMVNFDKEINQKIHRLGDGYDLPIFVDESAESEDLANSPDSVRILSFAEATLSQAGIDYVPPSANNYIYFFGPGNTWFEAGQQVPFFYVIDPQNWQNDIIRNGEFFRDKIVLIGATASSLQDIQFSAYGDMPGVEVHANAIATLMSNRAIAEVVPNRFQKGIAVLFLLMLVGIGLSQLKRPVIQFLVALAIALAWGIFGFTSLVYGNLIIATAMPVTAITLIGLSLMATGAIASQLERLQLRRTLSRYMAEPIVQEIMNQPDDYRALLIGRSQTAVVFFTDIRGFTTLLSKLPARDIVQQLNQYLEVMVDIILENQGTVDKFIGDAIMAEFGSPVSQGEKTDVMNSLKAALEMRSALANLRQEWKDNGKLPFFNGIGINWGEVVVGDIGSPRRKEYAVIGDTVNVASRVEGLTKELGTDILITDSVYELVKDEIEVVDMGDHLLRGRAGSIKLYGLVSLKGEDDQLFKQVQQELKRHLSVLSLLRSGKFRTPYK
ncbi:adenylate/guanylate cyclase with Chase sensor [Thalassoporum mexicanum PCC 7367]|nr:adenylate/guanylate cyclase with Chase sensor [Pseudanabaena sp. PCC 7367]